MGALSRQKGSRRHTLNRSFGEPAKHAMGESHQVCMLCKQQQQQPTICQCIQQRCQACSMQSEIFLEGFLLCWQLAIALHSLHFIQGLLEHCSMWTQNTRQKMQQSKACIECAQESSMSGRDSGGSSGPGLDMCRAAAAPFEDSETQSLDLKLLV